MSPSPASRLHSSTVASFLLRSLRTPLRLTNGQRPADAPPQIRQCRSLHLYKTARSRVVSGLHKAVPFSPYNPPAVESVAHKVNLFTEPGGDLVAEGVSLKTLEDKYIRPGSFLCLTSLTEPKKRLENLSYLKSNNVPHTLKDYYIAERNPKVKIAERTVRAMRRPISREFARVKEIHGNLASPPSYWRLSMDRAYKFLSEGFSVEFSLRMTGQKKNKEARWEGTSLDAWWWMHTHFPHLRPDFIKASMPEGTYWMIHPFSDGIHVQFVLATRKDSRGPRFTGALQRKRQNVMESIQAGSQDQLPKHVRKQLVESGNSSYSVATGSSKASVKEMVIGHGYAARWAASSLPKRPRREMLKSERRGREEMRQKCATVTEKPWLSTESLRTHPEVQSERRRRADTVVLD